MPVTVAVMGAGMRGTGYARRALATGQAEVVAVAEPDPERRARFAAEHGIPADMVFADWRELLARGKVADAAIIATQDRMHVEPAVLAAGLGYHLLLEKPMAPTDEEATRIAEAAAEAGVLLAVCHVMRYTGYTRTLKELLDAGVIGEIMNIQHLEQVGWWHQAHSFVRGNWRNEAESAPMLLAKACHDLDWMIHIKGALPERVSSFGDLVYFRPDRRPPGAGDRCTECAVETSCPYSAKRIYLGCLGDPAKQWWPLSVVTDDHTEEGVLAALREGPYGRCVFACDNDVVDSQVVTMEFADGTTATFTMTAFAALEHRKTRIFGTHGSIEGDGVRLRVHDFLTDTYSEVETGGGDDASAADGHGGGDDAILDAFVAAVRNGDPAAILSGGAESLATHRVVWAAEHARHTGTVVSLTPRGRRNA
ncbi:putative dehydrogenase [Streptosporangium becharense]|uniref:Putative dehydrogenase n=1 Tax=Streptosporangium becharense TaxID=1816182 RepID=A0A7W9MK48_9ACTN|nr:Gfo/Idh/MocA family oxidoreductase [Streptosporangium becharense]MBB2910381.1 putative dehydrogenase [Streptosporangium becharense]MBB5823124.1 putative dehydrogenase [Streptosporangium becharense]